MVLGFANNLISSLASDITASQTSIAVMPGDGPLFAALLTSDFSNQSTTLKNYAKITLTDSGETAFEICHLTAVNGDNLTVIRGQEGTAAKGWSLKDVIANFATRGSENAFPQIAHIQSGFYTSGTAGGAANALTLELPTTFFLNGSADWVLKTPLVVYPSQNNTGAATLQLTMGGKVLGTFPLYKGNKAQLSANDILKDVGLVCLLDNTKTFFNVANPGAIYAGLGTAAFHDITTTTSDKTTGHVLKVFDYGWGTSSGNMDTLASIFDVSCTREYRANGKATSSPTEGMPDNSGNSVFTVSARNIYTNQYWVTATTRDQIYTGLLNTETRTISWAQSYTVKYKPAATDVDAVSASHGGTFQNTIAVTNVSASAPFALHGNSPTVMFNELDNGSKKYYLLGDGGNFRLDEDSTSGNNVFTWNSAANTFTVNGEIVPSNYANFDARYVAGVQLGAEASMAASGGSGSSQTAKVPAGNVVTGTHSNYNDSNWEMDTLYYKPVQRKIAGVWATVAG